MPKDKQRYEKDEKEEKDEKDRNEKGEGGMEEKWRRDPLSGLFLGLVVISVGVLFLFTSQGKIGWDNWWAYFLVVLGCIFLLEAVVRYVMPAYRRPIFGKLIAGVVLIAIGASNIYEIGAAVFKPSAL